MANLSEVIAQVPYAAPQGLAQKPRRPSRPGQRAGRAPPGGASNARASGHHRGPGPVAGIGVSPESDSGSDSGSGSGSADDTIAYPGTHPASPSTSSAGATTHTKRKRKKRSSSGTGPGASSGTPDPMAEAAALARAHLQAQIRATASISPAHFALSPVSRGEPSPSHAGGTEPVVAAAPSSALAPQPVAALSSPSPGTDHSSISYSHDSRSGGQGKAKPSTGSGSTNAPGTVGPPHSASRTPHHTRQSPSRTRHRDSYSHAPTSPRGTAAPRASASHSRAVSGPTADSTSGGAPENQKGSTTQAPEPKSSKGKKGPGALSVLLAMLTCRSSSSTQKMAQDQARDQVQTVPGDQEQSQSQVRTPKGSKGSKGEHKRASSTSRQTGTKAVHGLKPPSSKDAATTSANQLSPASDTRGSPSHMSVSRNSAGASAGSSTGAVPSSSPRRSRGTPRASTDATSLVAPGGMTGSTPVGPATVVVPSRNDQHDAGENVLSSAVVPPGAAFVQPTTESGTATPRRPRSHRLSGTGGTNSKRQSCADNDGESRAGASTSGSASAQAKRHSRLDPLGLQAGLQRLAEERARSTPSEVEALEPVNRADVREREQGAAQPPGPDLGPDDLGKQVQEDGQVAVEDHSEEEEEEEEEVPLSEEELDEEWAEEQRVIAQGGTGLRHDEHGVPQPILAPLLPQDAGKKCLVLDLDETLVHSSFRLISESDFIVPVEIEGVVHSVYVAKRPGAEDFLRLMGELYEVVVFTASLAKYADPVLDVLDREGVVRHRLFRDNCLVYKGNYVKDLSELGRPLGECIILDNSPASYLFHPYNAVPISSWFNDAHDTELRDLCPFLADLATVQDVRAALDGRIERGRI